MVVRCWAVHATPPDSYTFYFCAENAYFQSQGGGVTVIFDGADLFNGSWIYANSILEDGNGAIPEARYNRVFGSCNSCPANVRYDCINNNCAPNSEYKTPGIYATLEECQQHCGGSQNCPTGLECLDPSNYCPPGKACIPNNKWLQIENLSNQLKNKNCS